MTADPVCTDPDKYQVVFENERVRVLEYRDLPGAKTRPHQHPDSVMYTLSGFQRRLHADQGTREVVMEAGRAYWLPAQTHSGENTGTTLTHVLFVELKDAATTGPAQRGGTGRNADAPLPHYHVGPS
jgi:quercetin dioxygenase-like cupin family protein